MLPKRHCCVCLKEFEDYDFEIFFGNVVCKTCVGDIAARVFNKGQEVLCNIRREREEKENAGKSGAGL